MEKIEQLIEEYKIRLMVANEASVKMIKTFPTSTKIRALETKQDCYRSFIAELEKIKTEK
jgi:hypothetical protein